jgi:hypothetical protein
MRRLILGYGVLAFLTTGLAWQAASANQTSLRAERRQRRQKQGLRPMSRAGTFRWSVLRQRQIPYNEQRNWTVGTLGFDSRRRTVVRAVNRKTGETFYAKARQADGSYEIKLVDKPGKTVVPVLHTNAYRRAFYKAAGEEGYSAPWRRKMTKMTTIAVTPRGESIMAVTTPGATTYTNHIVVAKGSYQLKGPGDIRGIKVQILNDSQLRQLGLFTPQELRSLAGEHSAAARYRKVDGTLSDAHISGRKTSVKLQQRADKAVVKHMWGDTVEILPKGRPIERWVNVLTGQETARNPRPVVMTKQDVKEAYEQLFSR